jgi:hypothetical protein
VVDFVRHWSERTKLPAKRLLGWAELSPRQYSRWQEGYGQAPTIDLIRGAGPSFNNENHFSSDQRVVAFMW